MHYRSVFLVAGTHPGWHDLARVLQSLPQVRVVGQAQAAQDTLRGVVACRPDAVIAPALLQGQSSLPLLRALREADAERTLVVIAERGELSDLVSLLELRVGGYLIWSELSEDMLTHCLAVALTGVADAFSRQVLCATTPIRPIGMPSLSIAPADCAGRQEGYSSLTVRERQVVQLLVGGRSTLEVAAELRISRRTMQFHLTNVMAKLGVRSRTEVVAALADSFSRGEMGERVGRHAPMSRPASRSYSAPLLESGRKRLRFSAG